MKFITKIIKVKTNSRNEMVNISRKVEEIVKKSGINNGLVSLFVPHTTAAVTINENADPDVKKDMLLGLSKISPDSKEYQHYEGNSDAHIKSSLFGVEQSILLENNKLILGTWQGLFFCEFDGPRSRNLIVRVMGE